MSRGRKQILIASIALMAVLACYFGVKEYSAGVSKRQQEEETAKMKQVTEFNVADVNMVIYGSEAAGVSLILENGTWKCTTDQTLEIDSEKVEDFLGYFNAIQSENEITGSENLEEFGLNEPLYSLSIAFTDGAILNGMVGDYNDVMGVYYFTVDAGQTVYTVDLTVVNQLSKTAEDFAVEESETVTAE